MNTLPLRLAFVAMLAASCTAPPPAERIVVADALFPGAVPGDRGPYLTRLVDDLTGAPVAGAEVFLVKESLTPIAGEFWFSHKGTSDAEGFVRIARPSGDRDWHIQVVRHPRYGVAARNHHVEPIWRLGAACDVPVRIVDWLGQPAPGARIGFCGYCGHTPDLVNAVADAQGLAVLRGIDPHNDIADLYVQHPGLGLFYDSVHWSPGDPPRRVQCSDAPPVTGRVVDAHGQAVVGAAVCAGGKHRGPWARTGADGSFCVLGASIGEVAARVVLADGREVHFPTKERTDVLLRLPDLVDARASEGTVERLPGAPATVPPVATRELRVRVENAPAKFALSCAFPGAESERERGDADTIAVPVRGPCVVTVHDQTTKSWNVFEYPFADAERLADPLVLRWQPQVRVRGRAVDAEGQPIAVRATWGGGDEDADGGAPEFALEAWRAGRAALCVRAVDRELPPVRLWVSVPERGSVATFDVGTVVLGASPRLRVLDADGAPLSRGSVGLLRAGHQQAGEPHYVPLDAEGGWRGVEPRAGDAIVVELGDESVPFQQVLRGDGPWTIQVPTGRLHLQVVDEEGEPLDATAVFVDSYAQSANGELLMAPLPHGPLRLFVSAPRHRSAIVDTVVDGRGKTLRVVLPRR